MPLSRDSGAVLTQQAVDPHNSDGLALLRGWHDCIGCFVVSPPEKILIKVKTMRDTEREMLHYNLTNVVEDMLQ